MLEPPRAPCPADRQPHLLPTLAARPPRELLQSSDQQKPRLCSHLPWQGPPQPLPLFAHWSGNVSTLSSAVPWAPDTAWTMSLGLTGGHKFSTRVSHGDCNYPNNRGQSPKPKSFGSPEQLHVGLRPGSLPCTHGFGLGAWEHEGAVKRAL